MPLWTVAAFGTLKDEDRLASDDPRYQLITHLVANYIQKVPNYKYDAEYRLTWKTSDFVTCVKAAVKSIQKN